MDKTKLSINIFFACLLWIFARSQKMDDTNPDAKEATCNGCFLQICFPATCPDLSCIGQFIILPIAFKDPPPWLFQSDIGSTILRWEEGSQLDHGKMVKQSFKHSFILCSFYWSFGCFRKVSFWNTNSGTWSQGHFVDIQEVSVPWQDPRGGGHCPNSPTSSGPNGLEFQPSWAVLWNKWHDDGLHDCR